MKYKGSLLGGARVVLGKTLISDKKETKKTNDASFPYFPDSNVDSASGAVAAVLPS